MQYEVIPMGDGVYRIQEDVVRSFLFCGSHTALLIDTGRQITNMREIVAEITSLPVIAVNTHADADHTRCNDQFDTVYMHPAEFSVYRKYYHGTATVKPVWKGTTFDLGGTSLEILLTPGHTPGSITLLDRERRLLVGGDGIQDWRIYMYGPFRSLEAYCASLERLLLRDDFDHIWPSHGSPAIARSQIPALLAGARAILSGSASAVDTMEDGEPITAYDVGAAVILGERRPNIQ